MSAIADRWKQPPDHAYTEEDWNTSGEAVARKEFTAPVAYGASKAVAERALWDWVDENKPSFAVAAINPGVVTGPPTLWPDQPEQLNETLRPVWALYAGEAKAIPPPIGMASYIDVRDVAALHIWAALHPDQSNGQRYLVSAIVSSNNGSRWIGISVPKSEVRHTPGLYEINIQPTFTPRIRSLPEQVMMPGVSYIRRSF